MVQKFVNLLSLFLLFLVTSIEANKTIYYIAPACYNMGFKDGFSHELFLSPAESSGNYVGLRTALIKIKRIAATLGYNFCVTSPSKTLKDVFFIIDHDGVHPDWGYNDLKHYPKKKRILLLGEPQILLGGNYEVKDNKPLMLNYYDKICATSDILYAKTKGHPDVLRIFFPSPSMSMLTQRPEFNKKKLLAFIGGDKSHWFKNASPEIKKRCGYLERKKFVDFIINNKIEGFDLYGGYNWTDWDTLFYKGNVPSVQNSQITDPDVVQGYKDKIMLLKNYKFYLCYENEINSLGWITEKIIDCFVAGSVPIYWGAPNIGCYIPENCYIDRKNFKNDKDLYAYIKNMTQQEYEMYSDSIKKFLKSDKAYLFSLEFFMHTLLELVIPEYRAEKVFGLEVAQKIHKTKNLLKTMQRI